MAAAASTPLVDFLVRQRRGRLGRLYQNPWTCEAVLRALPPLARHYVLRLVSLSEPAPFAPALLEEWTESIGAHAHALQWLLDLSIIEHAAAQPGMLRLNPVYCEQLGELLRGRKPPDPKAPNKHTPSEEQLDAHASRQWDQLLLTVVRPDLWASDVGYDMPKELLYPAGLIEVRHKSDGSSDEDEPDDGGGGGGAASIPYWAMSNRGAAFVLGELSAQAWHILQVYIGEDETKLGFLLELTHKRFGCAYAIEEAHRELVAELSHLGIVFVRDGFKSKSFYPTRLAAAIVSAGELSTAAQVHGRTIVESNMRVYVYTASRAWVEILRIFLQLRTLLPNAIVAGITRERMQRAMREHCLSADAIIGFLSRNAHEQVRNRVPGERDKAQTVYDQIRLWERELERYTQAPAYFLSKFETVGLFDAEVEHAKVSGTLLWHCRDAVDLRRCQLVLRDSESVVAETRARIKEYKRAHGLA
jgi:transcription initiation factor TFIIH subunit 4